MSKTETRDYVADLRAVIDAEFHDGDAAPVVAQRIVDKLRATDPDLLTGWLNANAVAFVRDAIAHSERSTRAHNRAVARRGVFSEGAAAGDVTAFLSTRYVVDGKGHRMALASMKSEHLRYVAAEYDADAKAARFEAAFMRALAKRVGTGTVSDHFTEQQITDLRRSLPGSNAA